MRKIILAIMTMTTLLTGCLAHMSATNLAAKLNNEAQREGSPYRWHVIKVDINSAALEKRLIGMVSPTKVSNSKKKDILNKIVQLEVKSGRSNNPQLKETRILSERNEKAIEAWVFNSSGNEFTYTIEHVLDSDKNNSIVGGPWGKNP